VVHIVEQDFDLKLKTYQFGCSAGRYLKFLLR